MRIVVGPCAVEPYLKLLGIDRCGSGSDDRYDVYHQAMFIGLRVSHVIRAVIYFWENVVSLDKLVAQIPNSGVDIYLFF